MMNKTLRSFRNAMNGIVTTWNEEHNFRIEIVVALVVLGLAIYFQFTFIELVFCIISIVLVLSAEIVNTAVEDMSDMIDSNPNPLIGKIKDTMAGYVLVTSLGAFAIGILVFYHHFFI